MVVIVGTARRIQDLAEVGLDRCRLRLLVGGAPFFSQQWWVSICGWCDLATLEQAGALELLDDHAQPRKAVGECSGRSRFVAQRAGDRGLRETGDQNSGHGPCESRRLTKFFLFLFLD